MSHEAQNCPRHMSPGVCRPKKPLDSTSMDTLRFPCSVSIASCLDTPQKLFQAKADTPQKLFQAKAYPTRFGYPVFNLNNSM